MYHNPRHDHFITSLHYINTDIQYIAILFSLLPENKQYWFILLKKNIHQAIKPIDAILPHIFVTISDYVNIKSSFTLQLFPMKLSTTHFFMFKLKQQ